MTIEAKSLIIHHFWSTTQPNSDWHNIQTKQIIQLFYLNTNRVNLGFQMQFVLVINMLIS